MDYNTNREKLIMPEYGRHIQKMIEHVKQIPDREKRNEQIQAVVSVMEILNPHLTEQPDYKHKLWDHVQFIAGFDLDVDSPYPVPTKEEFTAPPDIVPMPKEPLVAAHYGRNIQNMIKVIAAMPEDETRDRMIKSLAVYMRQQYLIWNKDSVSDETIFNDIEKLSGGALKVPSYIHLETISDKEKFNRPGMILQTGGPQTRNQFRPQGRNKNKKNKWKNSSKGKGQQDEKEERGTVLGKEGQQEKVRGGRCPPGYNRACIGIFPERGRTFRGGGNFRHSCCIYLCLDYFVPLYMGRGPEPSYR